MTPSLPTLHYVFDPLCGWCYGAAPLVEAARGIAGLTIAPHGGGMMTGANRQPVTEALRRCDGVLTGWGVRAGLERTRFAPSATGGPRTHLGASPEDHNLFHGDWLLYRRVVEEGDRAFTVFEGLWQPPQE